MRMLTGCHYSIQVKEHVATIGRRALGDRRVTATRINVLLTRWRVADRARRGGPGRARNGGRASRVTLRLRAQVNAPRARGGGAVQHTCAHRTPPTSDGGRSERRVGAHESDVGRHVRSAQRRQSRIVKDLIVMRPGRGSVLNCRTWRTLWQLTQPSPALGSGCMENSQPDPAVSVSSSPPPRPPVGRRRLPGAVQG